MTDLEAARLVAPNMDEQSIQIFVASGLFDLLYKQSLQIRELPRTKRDRQHHDVTGYFQRSKGSK